MGKRQLRDRWGCLVAFFITVGLPVTWGIIRNIQEKSHQEQTNGEKLKAQARESDLKQQRDNLINTLVRKHNAIIYSDQYEETTLNMQETLEKTHDQPILFISHIADILKEEEQYYLAFGERLLMDFPHLIGVGYYIIECDKEMVSTVRGDTRKGEFAIVAKNLSIETPLQQKYQRLTRQSSLYIVTGQCVEILSLKPWTTNWVPLVWCTV